MGYTKNQKPKMIGSVYINPPKGADKKIMDSALSAINFLKSNKYTLSISIKNDSGYEEYTAFFNGFKEKKEDRDLSVYPKLKSSQNGNDFTKKQVDSDDIPMW